MLSGRHIERIIRPYFFSSPLFFFIKKNNMKVIEVKPDGKTGIYGGAYSHYFVYSENGNFLVKGYQREAFKWIKEHINCRYFYNWVTFKKETQLIHNGVKVPININPLAFTLAKAKEPEEFKDYLLVDKTKTTNHWNFSNSQIRVIEPQLGSSRYYKKRFQTYHGIIMDNRKYNVMLQTEDTVLVHLKFKRMPNKWIPEFDKLYNP
jgi:hypothetical protein